MWAAAQQGPNRRDAHKFPGLACLHSGRAAGMPKASLSALVHDRMGPGTRDTACSLQSLKEELLGLRVRLPLL